MRRGWELLAMLVIGALLLQAAVAYILPLVPYMVGVVALVGIGLIGFSIYRRSRSW